MSIDTVRKVAAEDIEDGDELDLDGDDYGDNEMAVYGYAIVDLSGKEEWFDVGNDEHMVTLVTSQGTFDFPARHRLKVKIES